MYLLIDSNNTVIEISNICTEQTNGYLVDGNTVYSNQLGLLVVEVVEVPEYVEKVKFKYVDSEFKVVSENLSITEKEILDQYTMELIESGVI